MADRFRVLRPLAGGSAYSISYLADDLTRGEPIVVKEFFPRSLVARAPDGVTARPHSPESGRDFVRALRRFVIEGSVLSEIAHPHVVRVRGLVEANGTAYLVMDQHRSQSLTEYLRVNGGRLTPPLAGRIVQHLLTALEPLHGESIIHRDLSPRSVHVQGDGSVLLLEFSARRHLPLHATDLASGFAAFEQYGMRDIGPWTDVYSASALLYYLLTGVVPPSALDRAAGEAVQSPTTLVPNLSPGLARLVLRGMSLLPQQRPHVASELRRQLEASLTESAQPARGPQNVFATDAHAFSEGLPLEDDARGATLKLAAGGIVLPGDERDAGLLRRLGTAASRFRRTPKATSPVSRDEYQPPESMEPERRPSTIIEPTVVEAPAPRPAVVTPNELPLGEPARATPAPAAALVAMEERALPSIDDRRRPLDIAGTLALASEEFESHAEASNARRQYSMLAAAALVVAVAGSLAFLARSGSASSSAQSAAKETVARSATPALVPPPRGTVAPSHEIVEAGTVLQNASRAESGAARIAPAAPKTHAPESVERKSSPAPAPAAQPQSVLPSTKLPSVSVAIPGPSTDLKIVSPELLVDVRTRLTNGQDAVEQGDYAVARRTFRAALQQLDSLSARYPDSEKIHAFRRDLEQADARAVQACAAENEMRKRRGVQGKACQ